MLKNFKKQFGGKISSTEEKKLSKSPQWKGGKFENILETNMNINIRTLPDLLKKQFTKREERAPKINLPIKGHDKNVFNSNRSIPKFIWYGHSAALLQINGKNILIDPMLGPDASPIGPITTKRFSKNSLDIIDQLPMIDILLMTHDHYDHLDLASISKLKSKVRRFIVGLGTARHLIEWGIDTSYIKEMDWWDKIEIDQISFTYTPSRHFSGRGLTDRAKSLWGGWAIKTSNYNIFWSGDGGYGHHFKEIGEKLGPFDWGFMENGQYNENWHHIHMYPEESVKAALDAKVYKAFPVHWGGFVLALHPWKEPIQRFLAEAEKKELSVFTAPIGQIIQMDENDKLNRWWDKYE